MLESRGIRIISTCALFLTPLLLADEAVAHHSFAMFNPDKQVTIDGTIKQFTWSNPHVWVDVLVANDKGETQVWGLESQAVGILYRFGWNADSLKAGDKVTVLLHPMKDGTSGGQLMQLSFPDGRVLLTGIARP